MSNFYPNGLSATFVGTIDYDTNVMMAYLIRTGTGGGAGYAYNSAHSAIADIEDYNVASHGSANLGSKTVNASGSAFIFDAGDTTLASVSAVESGSVFHAYVTCVSGVTNDGNHIMMTYNDLTTPVTANGGNIVLQHNETGIGLIWTNA